MSTELILVRHGESVANVHPVVAGMQGDAGLTERGRRQAAALAERLAADDFTADVLYASTLPRAQQTARYLSDALGLPIVNDAELQEVRVGEADGLDNVVWSERWPGLADGLWRRPFQPFAPGGESWATFLARAGAGLMTLVERHPDQRVLAVTHGGVLEASFALAFGLGPTAVTVRYAFRNTGLTTWQYDAAGPRWTLVAANDTAHLPE